MADKLDIKAKAETTTSDKTKKQEADLAKAKAKKAEADRKAEEEKEKRLQEEAERKAGAEAKRKEQEEERKRLEEEHAKSEQKTEMLVNSAAALAGMALKTKKSGGFFKGLLLGFVMGALVCGMILVRMKDQLLAPVESVKDTADEILDDTFLGYTAADFKDAVLGEASQHQELIVMEQPLTIPTTITKAGLGKLAVFSKVKNITYAGTGVFTVDLKNLNEEHIAVAEEENTVQISIPHAQLQYTVTDYDRMTFEDTEKGLLAFGDLAFTAEQQNELEQAVKSAMEERLLEEDVRKQADAFAVMKTWEVFQPLVTAVSPEYKVDVVFDDTEGV